MLKRIAVAVACAVLLLPMVALAGEEAMAAQAAAKADFLLIWDDAAGKVLSLAEEFPSEKYAWRPAEGVRSVGEAFHHTANAVYLLASLMKAELPEGISGEMSALFERDGQTPGTKDEVIAELKSAFAYGRGLAETATAEQLAMEHDFFGQKRSGRAMFLLIAGHLQEHLGQEIAYARSTGVVPPWSKPEKTGSY